MSHNYRTETNCLNCGQEVNGKFCSNCGQENIEIHENFRQLIVRFATDYFGYDSKALRSLGPLFTKPGFLTLEYWDGRRANYIHPLRMFLFVAIGFVLATTSFYSNYGDQMKDSMFFEAPTPQKLDSAYLNSLSDSTKIYLPSRKDSVSAYNVRKMKEKEARIIRKLKGGIDMVFNNINHVSVLLLPVYAFIFFLFYRKKRRFYVDHFIYAIHFQTFLYCIFIVLLVSVLIFRVPFEYVRYLAMFATLIYLIISLRYLYQQSWLKTVIKSLLATFILIFVTTIAIILPTAIEAIFIGNQ